MFGPEYPKINTAFKRDEKGVIIPWSWSCPEFGYLAELPWRWTEKVDGTNIRLHWNGQTVTIGGKTDNAQVPATLVAALEPYTDPDLWRIVYGSDDDVTMYGEGYGARIQKGGGNYRQDQGFILFDVRIGPWWLEDYSVAAIASKFVMDTVPVVKSMTLSSALLGVPAVMSAWPEVQIIEGLVGKPETDLFNRKGERIITKIKVKDWLAYERKENAAR